MKTLNGKQLLSLTLAVLIAVPAISCSSKKKDYQVIKEDDTWYSCDKFYLNSFYPKEEYEYTNFETIGRLSVLLIHRYSLRQTQLSISSTVKI